jgi:hypothetical protein
MFRLSSHFYMFRRIMSAIFREPKVMLMKMYVCYVLNMGWVKAECGYRLYVVSSFN